MIKDIFLRNNYDVYLTRNRATSYNFFYNSMKFKLFSNYGAYNKFRTFYKIQDSNTFIVEVLQSGRLGYYIV